jgi:hypothetical protein
MTTPRLRRSSVPHVVTLAAGIALGWLLAGSRVPALRANAGDRWEDSILASGPTFIRYNESTKIQVAQDAIYYLDYRSGKLHATIPTIRQGVGTTSVLGAFGERDLVADFKLDLDTGPRPHFLMTTGSVPTGSTSTYGDGWAPLFVFESSTRQVAAYKVQQQVVGNSTTVRLDLLELRPFGAKTTAAR